MKGSYYFRVRSKRMLFEFTIRRNITVIKGDSATGKTTLLHMMYEYLRIGRESGYTVSTDSNYYVYLRQEIGRSWQDILEPLEDTVIFIEENNNFVFSKEFAAFGSMIENCLEYFDTRIDRRIAILMPESFEYLILNSGLIQSGELPQILNATSDYVDAGEYESWERYFTQLLISMTSDEIYQYSKKELNEYYLQYRNIRRIVSNFPDAIKKKQKRFL